MDVNDERFQGETPTYTNIHLATTAENRHNIPEPQDGHSKLRCIHPGVAGDVNDVWQEFGRYILFVTSIVDFIQPLP